MTNRDAQQLDEQLRRLMMLLENGDDLPPEDTLVGQCTRDFLHNNWVQCDEGLLKRTDRVRVRPELSPTPRTFWFEVDRPYKQKLPGDDTVRLMDGPIRGMITYRADLMSNLTEAALAVRLDASQGYLHPNYSRKHGLVCLGELPPGPFPLDALIENHLFPILSYQNRRPSHPADAEAARYFAMNPDAMTGLEPVEPLY